MAQADHIQPSDFPPAIFDSVGPVDIPEPVEDVVHLSFRDAKDRAVCSFERRYVEALMRRTKGNVSEAARMAGLDRSNFRRIVKRCQSDET